MNLLSVLIALILSLTGLVAFIHVNTILQIANYLQISDMVIFVVVLTFARIPFEILSFTTIGAFNEISAVAKSANQVQNFNVLLKQSLLAVAFAVLLFPLSTYVLPLIYSQIKQFAIIITALIFTFISFKYLRKNPKTSITVIILASACGVLTLKTLSSNGLFPLLTGLYAIPVMLIFKEKQNAENVKTRFKPEISIAGALAAFFSSLIPAISPALIAILASGVFSIETIAFQSLVFSIYASRTVFDFTNVLTIEKTRSMAATYLPWNVTYNEIITLLVIGVICLAITAALAYKLKSKIKVNVNSAKTKTALIALILLLTVIQSGPFGVIALITSSAIGIYALKLDNRVLLSASLITPGLNLVF